MRFKESVYAILLLMVLTIGGGGMFTQYICHCNDQHKDDMHHLCHNTEECVGHDLSIEHRCAADREVSFEYIIERGGVVVRTSLVTTLFMPLSDQLCLEEVCERELFDRWRAFDLYRGFSPSHSSLRAPPALV